MHVFCIFCICTCSAQLSMFHMERRSRNTLIIFTITNCILQHKYSFGKPPEQWQFHSPGLWEVHTYSVTLALPPAGLVLSGVCGSCFHFIITYTCFFVGCLMFQQQASVSQGRICADNFTCCHTEIEAADQTIYLNQSQYTETGPTSSSADPIMSGAWQGSNWSANFLSHWLDLEKSRRERDLNPRSSAPEADTLTTRPARRSTCCRCMIKCYSITVTRRNDQAGDPLVTGTYWHKKCDVSESIWYLDIAGPRSFLAGYTHTCHRQFIRLAYLVLEIWEGRGGIGGGGGWGISNPEEVLFFFFPCSPPRSLGITILGEIFAYVSVLNPTSEVVTFHLHGGCMCGVFLLLAFTCLQHEHQDLLSLCNGMHVCTD